MIILQPIRNSRSYFGALLMSGFMATQALAQGSVAQYAETIKPSELRTHLEIIAADSLEGRMTGSVGQKKAAAYMASHFKSYGLTPAATAADGSKSFFQEYELYRTSWGETYIKVKGKTYTLSEDFVSNGLLNVSEEVEVQTVFAGYGIKADGFDDYQSVDVKDKAVVILEGVPTDASGQSLLADKKDQIKWAGNRGWYEKTNLALSEGAKYVFIISSKDGREFEKEIKSRNSMRRRVNPLTLKPVEESLTNAAAFTVSKEMGAEMLGTSLKNLNKAIVKAGQKEKENTKLSGEIAFKAAREREVVKTENVAAFLEGTDKKDEILVISAHLDHTGIDDSGQINNGADDDGSGTVALLELAQAFGKAKAEGKGPRRSILFLNVTGEELGLFGSEYYSEHPLYPLSSTIANLNIDMIGRVDAAHETNHNYVYLIGSDKLSSELHTISEEANKKSVNFDLDYTFNDPKDPNRFYYRSDHYNFAKKGIPVIFYFTGVHPDYHRPTDDVDKILFDKQASITKLIFHTAWELVNREERIKVDSNKP